MECHVIPLCFDHSLLHYRVFLREKNARNGRWLFDHSQITSVTLTRGCSTYQAWDICYTYALQERNGTARERRRNGPGQYYLSWSGNAFKLPVFAAARTLSAHVTALNEFNLGQSGNTVVWSPGVKSIGPRWLMVKFDGNPLDHV